MPKAANTSRGAVAHAFVTLLRFTMRLYWLGTSLQPRPGFAPLGKRVIAWRKHAWRVDSAISTRQSSAGSCGTPSLSGHPNSQVCGRMRLRGLRSSRRREAGSAPALLASRSGPELPGRRRYRRRQARVSTVDRVHAKAGRGPRATVSTSSRARSPRLGFGQITAQDHETTAHYLVTMTTIRAAHWGHRRVTVAR